MLKEHAKKIVYTAIGIFLFALLYALKNTSYFTRASTFIFSVVMFFIVDYFFALNFKKRHYLIFILISAAGVLLSPLYFISSSYDKILHLSSPFFISILIFFLINKLKTKFSIKLLLTISIVIALLTLFEIGEFTLDKLFDLKLQGVYLRDYSGVEKLNIIMDKNDDTMIDLILGTISALIFALAKITIFHYKRYILKEKV